MFPFARTAPVPWCLAAFLLVLSGCRSSKSFTTVADERRDSLSVVSIDHHFRDVTQMVADSVVERQWVWQVTDSAGHTTTYRKAYSGRNAARGERSQASDIKGMAVDSTSQGLTESQRKAEESKGSTSPSVGWPWPLAVGLIAGFLAGRIRMRRKGES